MRTITISLMVVAVLVVGGLSIKLEAVKAGYNYKESLGPDIIDGLMQIPPDVKKKYGETDKERLVYNIAELLVTRKDHTARIKALEQLVKELQAQVDSMAKTDMLKSQIEFNAKRIESMAWLTKITFHDEYGKMTGGWDPNEVAK